MTTDDRMTAARVHDAVARWQRYAFTRALRAVDPARVAAESAAAPGGPLRGLLFSVKDLFPVAGVESCAGSLLLAGQVPAADYRLLAALRAAGAVPFGKGVCAEFGFGVDTENRLDGRVLHFADPELSPGGSSGGDAVAVGAGIVDFAVAGDYGGSIRWPAQATGVFGLRFGVAHRYAGAAATGRIGLCAPAGCWGAEQRCGGEQCGGERCGAGQPASATLQSQLETAGLMARSPAMLRAVLAVLAAAGPGPESSGGAGAVAGSPAADAASAAAATGSPAAMRIVVTDGTEIAPVGPAAATALAAARCAAERAGYRLVPAPDALRAALWAALPVYAALRAATDDHHAVRRLAAGREELLCGPTRAILSERTKRERALPDPAAVTRLRERASRIGAAVRAALRMSGADALLMPVAAHGPTAFGGRAGAGGRTLDVTELMAHCRAVSLTGLPALAVPASALLTPTLVTPTLATPTLAAAPTPGGQPRWPGTFISVQLVGLDGGEDTLCAIAADLAAA
jgi:amidase